MNRLPVLSMVATFEAPLFDQSQPIIGDVCSLSKISSISPSYRLNMNNFPFFEPTAAYFPVGDIPNWLASVEL